MGTEELLGVICAAVFPDLVSRSALPVVDLEEVEVAVGAALQMEEREGDAQDLKKRQHIDLPLAFDFMYSIKKNLYRRVL